MDGSRSTITVTDELPPVATAPWLPGDSGHRAGHACAWLLCEGAERESSRFNLRRKKLKRQANKNMKHTPAPISAERPFGFRIHCGPTHIEATGARWEHDGSNFRLLDTNGAVVLSIPSKEGAEFAGHISIQS